jgi:hypothetical protein
MSDHNLPFKPVPLFIFSLPRTGSTLLQRILGAHDQIATVTEPWILLPFIYSLRPTGLLSKYSQTHLFRAVEDFYGELPRGKEDYLECLRDFVLTVYGKACRNREKYFLDKTPRYHLIVSDIIRLFPEGKFIFLWRNPLAIISSIIESDGRGKWKIHDRIVDLFDGIDNLVSAFDKYADLCFTVRYEDMVSNPDLELQQIFNYIGLSFSKDLLSNFNQVKLQGWHGDKAGITKYQTISTEPLDKWKSNLNNPIRKSWCRRYLEWIGEDRLATMGYSKHELICDLNSAPVSLAKITSDIRQTISGKIYSWFETPIRRNRLQQLRGKPGWEREERTMSWSLLNALKIFPLLRNEDLDWNARMAERLVEFKNEVENEIPTVSDFILIDDCQLGYGNKHALPFLERDGYYYGHPEDDSTAISELERMREAGAAFAVIPWLTFWWFDQYPSFYKHLRRNYRCPVHSKLLVIFDLRARKSNRFF